MVAQIFWAVVVAVLLVAVSVGWAIRGAREVRGRLASSQQLVQEPVRPEFFNRFTVGRSVYVWALALSFAILFFAWSMERSLPVLAAGVLSFTYALLSAMATGFMVWVRSQRRVGGASSEAPESDQWAAWVGVAIGALAASYVAMDVVTNLML